MERDPHDVEAMEKERRLWKVAWKEGYAVVMVD